MTTGGPGYLGVRVCRGAAYGRKSGQRQGRVGGRWMKLTCCPRSRGGKRRNRLSRPWLCRCRQSIAGEFERVLVAGELYVGVAAQHRQDRGAQRPGLLEFPPSRASRLATIARSSAVVGVAQGSNMSRAVVTTSRLVCQSYFRDWTGRGSGPRSQPGWLAGPRLTVEDTVQNDVTAIDACSMVAPSV